jgi:CBS domain containing-hemolysin-like protein
MRTDWPRVSTLPIKPCQSNPRKDWISPDMGYLEILLIAGLILINGFFVTVEFALVKVRTTQIDQLAEQGNWAAKLTSKALDRLDFYLSASQIGITVASLALGRAMHDWVEPLVESAFRGMGIRATPIAIFGVSIPTVTLAALSLVTFLHMALGEQAPKSLAIRSPRVLALLTAPPLVILSYVFSPVIWLLNKASNLTLWALGLGQTNTAELAHSEEELRLIVAESVAGGHLSRNERIMIENVLNLEEKTARRVMIPRPDIVYLSLARPLEDNLRLARQAGHTRFPLCEDDLSTVIGMIHVKDIFRAGAYQNGRSELRQLARKVPFLPVTLRLDQLLLEFQRNRVHLAMLLDEYGSVVGMVTLENVLEELVGPIQDEFDRETPPITPLGEKVYEVDASCPLDVLAETCGLEIPETDAETVGGLVLDLLGRLAKPGDSVVINGHRLTVLRADPTRIRRIRLEPLGTETASSQSGEVSRQVGKSDHVA